jgi:hypothetical protein
MVLLSAAKQSVVLRQRTAILYRFSHAICKRGFMLLACWHVKLHVVVHGYIRQETCQLCYPHCCWWGWWGLRSSMSVFFTEPLC